MTRLEEKDIIPLAFINKEVEKKIAELSSGEEAVVKGHITYDTRTADGTVKFRPVFLVTSITPVSLTKLRAGKVDSIDPAFNLHEHKDFSPLTIPVTTEVASSLTLTTALLLMQSLTASSDPQGRQQINQGIIIFAGALATGSFIIDQIRGQKTSR